MGRLQGKNVIITGGSSGIGKATVELFVKEGANVVIADIRDDKGNELSDKLGDQVDYIHTDVSKEADIKNVIDFTIDKYGGLDCIFNNAGIVGAAGNIAKTDVGKFDETLDVLFKGVFLGIKYAAQVMLKQKKGCIISTASIAGLRTGYAAHIYSACKAAVIHLTKSVAMELGESNIRVNCICPGGIKTAIFGKAFNISHDDSEKVLDVLDDHLTGMQPLKQPGLPEHVAHAALWLASEDSAFVNGHALVVDGGITGGKMFSDFQESYFNMYLDMKRELKKDKKNKK